MKHCIWVFCVFFGLIFAAPLLLIMIAFVRTDVSLGTVMLYWLPISIVSSLLLTNWYKLKAKQQES